MATLEISLSRAHKIAERLSILMKDTLEEAKTASEVVSFSARPSPSSISALATRGEDAVTLSSLAHSYALAWVVVRSAIASENHKRGIDAMLAKLEVLNKITAAYKVMVTTSKTDGYLPLEVGGYVPESGSYGFNLVVNPVKDITELLQSKLKVLQRESIELSDSISDANAHKLTLELPDDIAEKVIS